MIRQLVTRPEIDQLRAFASELPWSGTEQWSCLEYRRGEYGTVPGLSRAVDSMRVYESPRYRFSRVRLMNLPPGCCTPSHSDDCVVIHVPIKTNPACLFHFDDCAVHMPTDTAWKFDAREPHTVTNDGDTERVHLVLQIAEAA